jgi:hypothetical protein
LIEVVVLVQVGATGKNAGLQIDLKFFAVMYNSFVFLRDAAGSGMGSVQGAAACIETFRNRPRKTT